jgi:hypothetical protein
MIPFLAIISLLLIGVHGCNQSQKDEPIEVAKQFITTKYQIDDYENIPDIEKNVEKYLTSKELKRFRANREGYFAQFVAKDLICSPRSPPPRKIPTKLTYLRIA